MFIDLTEEGEYELAPYAGLLKDVAASLGKHAEHYRLPIPDMDIPSPEVMNTILDCIDRALQSGQAVYLHCYGGTGRTGTAVGCYLVRHGLSGEEALNRIAALLGQTPKRHRSSPETESQREMVLSWSPRRSTELTRR
jgi:protein-tyrosine phosphatase